LKIPVKRGSLRFKFGLKATNIRKNRAAPCRMSAKADRPEYPLCRDNNCSVAEHVRELILVFAKEAKKFEKVQRRHIRDILRTSFPEFRSLWSRFGSLVAS
jgi:hypothetical protein